MVDLIGPIIIKNMKNFLVEGLIMQKQLRLSGWNIFDFWMIIET